MVPVPKRTVRGKRAPGRLRLERARAVMRRIAMTRGELRRTWNRLGVRLKQQWARLTQEDLEAIAAHPEEIYVKLLHRYGFSRERAQSELDDFLRYLGD
jgi:hypothetical protein